MENSFGTTGTNCDNRSAVIIHFTIEMISQDGVRLLESSILSNKKSLIVDSLWKADNRMIYIKILPRIQYTTQSLCSAILTNGQKFFAKIRIRFCYRYIYKLNNFRILFHGIILYEILITKPL